MAKLCSNADHPDGPFHPYSEKPRPWDVVEWFDRRLRVRRYGCACASEGRVAEERFEAISTAAACWRLALLLILALVHG